MDTDAGQELDAADDIDASSYFSLNVLNNGVTIRISDAVEPLPAKCNLFTISNMHGWAAWATATGFAITQLANLREQYVSAPQRTTVDAVPARVVEVGAGGITFLHFVHGDNVLLATGPAMQGGIAIWQFTSLIDGSNLNPAHVFPSPSPSPVTDVLPNPDGRPELVALLCGDGRLYMLNLNTQSVAASFGESLTAACWSAKGKQIVCGDQSGTLTQYTPEGSPAQAWPPPASQSGHTPLDIRWLENLVFFVTYIDPTNPLVTDPYIVMRERKDSAIQYQQLLDPLMVENPDRQESRRNVWLRNWAPFKHLLLVANGTSNTISHIGQAPQQDGEQADVWAQVKNDLYTTLPLDTLPTGLEIDLSSAAPSGSDSVEELPMPILWSSSSDGTLSAWHVVNQRGGQYSGIKSINAAAVSSSHANGPSGSSSMQSSISDMGALQSGPAPAFAPTSGSKPSFTSQSSFGASSSFGKSSPFAPAFGQSAFGQGAAAPAFGQSAFGKPAFGSSNLTPAASPFGKPSASGGFASFGKSGEKSAFASPSDSIDSPFASRAASPSAAPAFVAAAPVSFTASTFGSGNSALSPSPFGGAVTPPASATMSIAGTPKTEAPKSIFGATSTSSSAFGTSSFADKAAPRPSPFGAQISPSPFGQKPSAFGTTSAPSAFGATQSAFSSAGTPPNAFGSSSDASVFGGARGQDSGASDLSKAGKGVPGLDDDDEDSSAPPVAAAASASQDLPSFGGFGFGAPAKPATTTQTPKLSQTSPFSSAFSTPSAFAKPEAKNPTQATDAPKPSFSFGGAPTATAKSTPSVSGFGQPAKFGQSAFAPSTSTALSKTDTPTSSAFAGFATKLDAGASSPFARSGASSPFGSATASKPETSPFGKAADSKPPAFFFGQAKVMPDRKLEVASNESSGKAAETSSSSTSSKTEPPAIKAESSADEFVLLSKPGSPPTAQATTSGSSPEGSASEQPEVLSDDSQEATSEVDESQLDESQLDNSESDASQTGGDDSDGSQPEGTSPSTGGGEAPTAPVDAQTPYDGSQAQEQASDDKPASAQVLLKTPSTAAPSPNFTSQSISVSNVSSDGGLASPSPLPLSQRSEHVLPPKAPTFLPANANLHSSDGETDATPDMAASASDDRKGDAKVSSQELAKDEDKESVKAFSSGPAKTSASAFSFGQQPSFGINNKNEAPAKPFGFANLQKTTPRTSSPLASMSFAPTASPVKNESTSRPALPTTQSASPFMLNAKQTAPTPVQPITPIQRTVSAPSAPQILAPQPQTTISRPPAISRASSSLSGTSHASETEVKPLPRMTPTPTRKPSAARAQQGDISLFFDMQEQMDELNVCTQNCIDYFKSVQTARLPPAGSMLDNGEPYSPLDTSASTWSLGDLPRLHEIAEMLHDGADDLQQIANSSEAESQKLQSSALQLQAKLEEVARYLDSRDDPAFARLVKTRQLSPEQQSNQLRIRSSMQAVEMALETAESAVARLKQSLNKDRLNRKPMQAPTLDSIYRTSRNIGTALMAKRAELDELQLRVEMLNMNMSAVSDVEQSDGDNQTPRKALTNEAHNVHTTTAEEIDRKVQQILDREVFGRTFREKFLAAHKQPLLSTSKLV